MILGWISLSRPERRATVCAWLFKESFISKDHACLRTEAKGDAKPALGPFVLVHNVAYILQAADCFPSIAVSFTSGDGCASVG